MSRVVPAILTEDPKALATMVRQAESFTDFVQLDMMDGQFVPSHSIGVEHLAGLPMKLGWEAHLMVLKPETYFAGLKQAGARKVVFHYEATASPREVIAAARRLGLGVGLAINPETPVAAFLPLVSEVDSVLFLSVHPGFYGAKFLPEVVGKLVEFRRARPHTETGIDGGIKESNISQVAGADVIYVGSAIFLQPQPGEAFRHLQALAQ
ncbi:MAG: ribulose-phosphate 3-epimerase [Chloroflexota bacterium]|nr:ribulose-phosphate 3-epimerase [Chloroflexota bacterium]